MLTEQFKNYVKSFNKNPGEFTKEEAYEIGLTHKALPQNEKSWKELNQLIGLHGTPNALRMFINDYTKKVYNRLEWQDYNEKKEEKTSTTESLNTSNNKYEENYKLKTQIRDTYNAYRRNLRDEARIDVLKEFIEDCVKKIPETFEYSDSYVFEDYPGYDEDENVEAVLMLSDLHIGVECDNFYNKFNSEIALKRLNKLCKDVVDYCQRNHVYRLNVLNLGDMIHGIIHVNARLEQQFDVIEQTIKASELIAGFLNNIQRAAPEVIYRSVLDNHSRVIANKNEHIEKENLNRIIDWYLKERLSLTGVKFVNDNLDAGLGKFKLMNGKNVIFAHGHQESIDKSLQNFVGATEEFIHYALLGHYHSEKVKSFHKNRICVP